MKKYLQCYMFNNCYLKRNLIESVEPTIHSNDGAHKQNKKHNISHYHYFHAFTDEFTIQYEVEEYYDGRKNLYNVKILK